MNEKNIKYGRQDFETGLVEVYINDELIMCEMFQDDDGDFGFYLNDEVYYFYICERI